MAKQYKSVHEYFNDQNDHTRRAMLILKECILKIAPEAIEKLNYNIPAYELTEGGKREAQIMIAANKNSVGFYPHPTTIEKFKIELKDFKSGKGSVQFSLDESLPIDLIQRMVDYRYTILRKG